MVGYEGNSEIWKFMEVSAWSTEESERDWRPGRTRVLDWKELEFVEVSSRSTEEFVETGGPGRTRVGLEGTGICGSFY